MDTSYVAGRLQNSQGCAKSAALSGLGIGHMASERRFHIHNCAKAFCNFAIQPLRVPWQYPC
jgi:hypothetical protein